eukprot:CAMPEP_0116976348 /NCGR_PEP_ID=MMETSP0467-20121206/56423_1 /TAXON_ID=283647 /ORGANISM="Mesodinium pulex, Strain SPMC105" /LENGTH=66 /DNA_ID=CAMNT_0004669091 /DNA_START=325 /DNA_END=525 /DNA_ORIENTATION=+
MQSKAQMTEKRYANIVNSKTSYSVVVDLTGLDDDDEVRAPAENGKKRRRTSSSGGTLDATSSVTEI